MDPQDTLVSQSTNDRLLSLNLAERYCSMYFIRVMLDDKVRFLTNFHQAMITTPFRSEDIENAPNVMKQQPHSSAGVFEKTILHFHTFPCVQSLFLSHLFGSVHEPGTLSNFRYDVNIVQSLTSSYVLSATDP